jgi:TetR/AcrR family transcriptional repressor of nem operon
MTDPTTTRNGYAKGEETRRRILDAAMTVFRARGYAATRVEDICAEAGLTKGGFFHHFPDKPSVALSTARHFGDMAAALFAHAPFRAPEDPAERVLAYVRFRAEGFRGSYADFTCYLGTIVQETYLTQPALRDACGAVIDENIDDLGRDLAAAKARHCPDAAWDPQSLAAYVQCVVQGAMIIAKAADRPMRGHEMMMHLHRHLHREFNLKKTGEDHDN